MREEILRILDFNTKDLPRKKRYLYTLGSLLFYSVHAFIFVHLGSNLPFRVFFVIWGVFGLLLICLYQILKGKTVESGKPDI